VNQKSKRPKPITSSFPALSDELLWKEFKGEALKATKHSEELPGSEDWPKG